MVRRDGPAGFPLRGAAGEPGAGALEGRLLNDPEAEKVLIKGERPREIGNDEINMVERKLSHRRATITRWAVKATRQRRRLGAPAKRVTDRNGCQSKRSNGRPQTMGDGRWKSTANQQSNPIKAAGPHHR